MANCLIHCKFSGGKKPTNTKFNIKNVIVGVVNNLKYICPSKSQQILEGLEKNRVEVNSIRGKMLPLSYLRHSSATEL